MRRIYHPRISDSEGTLPVIHGGLGSRDIDKAAQNIGLVTYRLANKPFGIILYNAQKRISKDSLPPEISDPSVPSLYGNREVEVGQTLILKITNYDSFTIYTVFATNGVAIQRGEEIHYTAGVVSGPGSITINGRTFLVTIKSPRPLTPSVVVPSEDSQLSNTTAAFEATAFNIIGNYDIHASTDWEVSTDPQFNTLIAAIYETTVHKLTWTVNNMQELKKHYVRVRYRGQQRGVSDWSPVREFTTGNDGLVNTEMGKIVSNPRVDSDRFGRGVAVNSNGDIALISAFFDDNDSGAVYYFKKIDGIWTQISKFKGPDTVAGDRFGDRVTLNAAGDYALIGATNKDDNNLNNSGVVYIFTRSGDTWTYYGKIYPNDKTRSKEFGLGVVLNPTATVALIGALEDTPGTDAGAVYYFTRSGNVWTQQQKFQPSDVQFAETFGYYLAINSTGTLVFIGAPNRDEGGIEDCGAVYYFTRSGNVWTQQGKIIIPDGNIDSWFGISVALSHDETTLYIGAPGKLPYGAVYVYLKVGSSWVFERKILPSSSKFSGFGGSLALTDESKTLLIGSEHDRSVYIFQ